MSNEPRQINAQIRINLDAPSDARMLANDELFQLQALGDLTQKIKSHLNQHENVDSNPPNVRVRFHNAITISGGRGSGKTTFLLNAIDHIEKSQDIGIHVLPIIDPTLISTKEHVLVIIISLIKKAIDNDQTLDSTEKSSWRDSLRNLAGGLCQIEGIGPDKLYGDGWDDKTYVLETGLEKAIEGFNFECNFNDFLERSLRLLQKKAFVVVFDDIDTKFESGWPVLESIRKYLTSPKLLTIISGDIKLYSTLVRRAQFQNFGELSLRYDRPASGHHNEVRSWAKDRLIHEIDQLEDQYLMKVLKPENRITIQPLARVHYDSGYSIVVRPALTTASDERSVREDGEPLADYLEKVFKSGFGIRVPGDIAAFSRAILELPARTVWQFLKAGQLLQIDGNRKAFAERVVEIFSASLFKIDIQPDELDLMRSNVSQGVHALWRWATESEYWEEVYRLYPEYLDSMENQRAIAFGAYFSALLEGSHANIFEFMVKAGWARELLLQNQNQDDPGRKEKVISYLGLDRNEKMATVARRGVVLQRSRSTGLLQGGTYRGTTHVPSSPRAKIHSVAEVLYGVKTRKITKTSALKQTIESTLKTVKYLQESKYLGAWWRQVKPAMGQQEHLPCLIGVAYNTLDSLARKFEDSGEILRLAASTALEPVKGEKSAYLSVYALIGALGELLSVDDDELYQSVSWLAQQRVYPTPPWLVGAGGEGAEGLYDEKDDDIGDSTGEEAEPVASQNSKFIGALRAWVKAANSRDALSNIPPYVFSRIMARLFFTLERMDNELSDADLYTGNVLHRQIVAFLNAILVEEARGYGSGKLSGIRLANPTTSDAIFIQNYLYIRKQSQGSVSEQFPLFRMMFSCPLLGIFVDPTVDPNKNKFRWIEEQATAWSAYCSNQDKEEYVAALRVRGRLHTSLGEVEFPNLWSPLNTVPLLGAKSTRKPQLLRTLKEKQPKPLENSTES